MHREKFLTSVPLELKIIIGASENQTGREIFQTLNHITGLPVIDQMNTTQIITNIRDIYMHYASVKNQVCSNCYININKIIQ